MISPPQPHSSYLHTEVSRAQNHGDYSQFAQYDEENLDFTDV